MKAYVIKNKDGYYLVNTFAWSKKLIHAYIDESEKDLGIVLKNCKDCTIVPITICEGDLENYIESIEKINDKLTEERYIFKKALELACDGYVKPNVYGTDIWEEAEKCGGLEQYFIQQAKESEKNE